MDIPNAKRGGAQVTMRFWKVPVGLDLNVDSIDEIAYREQPALSRASTSKCWTRGQNGLGRQLHAFVIDDRLNQPNFEVALRRLN